MKSQEHVIDNILGGNEINQSIMAIFAEVKLIGLAFRSTYIIYNPATERV